MKKENWKVYLVWIGVCEAVGILAGFLSREGIRAYNEIAQKPPLSPPAIVFPIVWFILYALMGIGAAGIWLQPESKESKRGITLMILQLIVNFFWPLLFFNAQAYGFAFFWLILLWILVLWMILVFRKVDLKSTILQLPYLAWLTFAAYLNAFVWVLNG